MNSRQTNVEVDCTFIGQFDEENVIAHEGALPSASQGEVEHPVAYFQFEEVNELTEPLHRFTVLLRDERVVTVRGHAVKCIPGESHPSAQSSYGIVVRHQDREDLVALFPTSEVKGVFDGEVHLARASA